MLRTACRAKGIRPTVFRMHMCLMIVGVRAIIAAVLLFGFASEAFAWEAKQNPRARVYTQRVINCLILGEKEMGRIDDAYDIDRPSCTFLKGLWRRSGFSRKDAIHISSEDVTYHSYFDYNDEIILEVCKRGIYLFSERPCFIAPYYKDAQDIRRD